MDYELPKPVLTSKEDETGAVVWNNSEGKEVVKLESIEKKANELYDLLSSEFKVVEKLGWSSFSKIVKSPQQVKEELDKKEQNKNNLVKRLSEMLAEIEIEKIQNIENLGESQPADIVIDLQDIYNWKGKKFNEGKSSLSENFFDILNNSGCTNIKKLSPNDISWNQVVSDVKIEFISMDRSDLGNLDLFKQEVIKKILEKYPEVRARVIEKAEKKVSVQNGELTKLDKEVSAEVDAAKFDESSKPSLKIIPNPEMSERSMAGIAAPVEEEKQPVLQKSVIEEFAKAKEWNYQFNKPSEFRDPQTGMSIIVPTGTGVDLKEMEQEIEGSMPFGISVTGGIYINGQYLESDSISQMQLKKTEEGFELVRSKGDRVPNFSKDKSKNNTIPDGIKAETIQYSTDGQVKSIENNGGLWTEVGYKPEVVVVELNGQMYRISGKNIADIKSISFGEDGELLCGGRFGDGENISRRQTIEGLVIDRVDQTDEEIVLVEAKSINPNEKKKFTSKLKRSATAKTLTSEEFNGEEKPISKKVSVEKTAPSESLGADGLTIALKDSLEKIDIGYFLEADGVMRPIDISLRKKPVFDSEGNYSLETQPLTVEFDGARVTFDNPNDRDIDMLSIKRDVNDFTEDAGDEIVPVSIKLEFKGRNSKSPETEIRKLSRRQVKFNKSVMLPDAIYTLDRTVGVLQQFTLQEAGESTHSTFFTMSDIGLVDIILKSNIDASTAKLKLNEEQLLDLKTGNSVQVESDWGEKFTIQFKDGKIFTIENLEL